MQIDGNANGRGPVPVLLMVRELNLGGIERDATKIAIHLDRCRFTPHVASYSTHGARYEELRAAGIPMLHVPVTSLTSRSALSGTMTMRTYIRRHGIRLVHAMDASSIFAAPVARLSGVPAVLSSMLGSRKLLDQRTHRLLRFNDRIVDAIVVNCDAMRRHLVEDENVPADRIELCYNGVDTSEFYPGPVQVPRELEGASVVIGAICVLRPEKALHLLQEAFARIRGIDSRMRLLIVGEGPERSRLLENSKRLGIEDACVFLPATAKVAPLLRAIDIFVLCSVSEAFSNALLEAMACGCCAIGSRVGGTPELTGENERGLLFESGNVEDLARRLTTVVRDAHLRKDLGRRAAEFARTNLSIQAAAARTAEIYTSVLARKDPLLRGRIGLSPRTTAVI